MSATMRGPDHVALGQIDEGHLGDAAEDVLEADQPRAPAGHVDLGDVAGDHHLGTEPDPGEEHLHLLGVVFWASSRMMKLRLRVRPRMKASGATSMVPRSSSRWAPSGSEQVVEGVVEGAQVGVDLGHDVAGQEAQALTGLHRRSGQDDPVDLAGLQRLHARATARYDLPVPAGPMPKVTTLLAMASV
jgi:hypothetical protein